MADPTSDGSTFRQDVFSVLAALRQHHVSILETLDDLHRKWGDGCLSASTAQSGFSKTGEQRWNSRPTLDRHARGSSPSPTISDVSVPKISRHLLSSEARLKRKQSMQLEYGKATDHAQKRWSSFQTYSMSMNTSNARFNWDLRTHLCKAVTESSAFNFVVVAIIILNAAFVGYEVNLEMAESLEKLGRGSDTEVPRSQSWLTICDLLLNAFFRSGIHGANCLAKNASAPGRNGSGISSTH